MAQPVQAGESGCSPGLRSDPFFADVEGAFHGLEWTGHDDFAGNNVDSIALEVPNDMLGAGPVIGAWASISRRRDGTLAQMDRDGNPSMNPIIIPDDEKDVYNARQPADDVNTIGAVVPAAQKRRLLAGGGARGSPNRAPRHPPLRPQPSPSTYPNGRKLTDDVYSYRFAWLSHGKVPDRPQAARRPAGALPYLGPPNPQPPRTDLLRASC